MTTEEIDNRFRDLLLGILDYDNRRPVEYTARAAWDTGLALELYGEHLLRFMILCMNDELARRMDLLHASALQLQNQVIVIKNVGAEKE